MNIALISPEAIPYSKTGGLGDVAGSLFREYNRIGLDVTLFVPLYKTTASIFSGQIYDSGIEYDVPLGGYYAKCKIFQISIESPTAKKQNKVYLIANESFFNRNELYGEENVDYPDNAARFAFFSRSVMEACLKLNIKFDILHCHDWQTALIPLYVKKIYRNNSLFEKTKTVFTIHNLGYQGNFPLSAISVTGLGKELLTPEGLEFYGRLNFMKAGIIGADLLTTVSPTYAKEIITPEHGFGLDGLLRTRQDSLYGILNGIDYDEWNPSDDNALPALYSAENLTGKKKCKQKLFELCSYSGRPEAPALCFIGRLVSQKGINLITAVIDELVSKGLKIFILGKGEAELEKTLTYYAKRYPGDMYLKIGFDDKLARIAYAGSDIFLMPSVYEPCGLGQMIAMRYGTVPVAFNTGGLADSVKTIQDDIFMNKTAANSNGFLFYEHTPKAFLAAIGKALQAYSKRSVWRNLVRNAMKTDFSWQNSINKYIELYKKALRHE